MHSVNAISNFEKAVPTFRFEIRITLELISIDILVCAGVINYVRNSAMLF